jgi:hypothetical protein
LFTPIYRWGKEVKQNYRWGRFFVVKKKAIKKKSKLRPVIVTTYGDGSGYGLSS